MIARIAVGLLVVLSPMSVVAQIVPDQTFDVGERSQLTPARLPNTTPMTRIDGGAIRGSNLFHSFEQFNLQTGQRAYFANPTGITNIFSRVTGSNPSSIDGTLGILGNANRC
jgi:large exoprotein involved in heme utilization and adhesion